MRIRLVSKRLVLGVWLVFSAPILGIPTEIGVVAFHAAKKTIRAVKTERPPKIDGFIESVWVKADSVTEFIQPEPKATERTVAYFLYDDQNLYVAFKCYDSDPEKLVILVGPKGQHREELEAQRQDHCG